MSSTDESENLLDHVSERINPMRAAFEQRECDLETYLAALRDWMVAKAEVTVAEFRVQVLEPSAGDERSES